MSHSPFSVSVQELFEAAVHYGHKTHKWNPRIRQYLFGERNGIHIFDLQKTAKSLEDVLEYVRRLSAEGKVFLFVGTKPQALSIVSGHAKRAGMPFVTGKWIPGLLTNFSTLSRRISYLRTLKDEEERGEFAKYTKKEVAQLQKTIAKLDLSLGGVSEMKRLPDVVFVVDVHRDTLPVKESKKMKIPVIGIVDSNADPTPVDFVIPGNDDSIHSLEYFVNKIADAVLAGKKAMKSVI